MKDHQIRELVNELRDVAIKYHGTQQLRERIARTVRAAMLQAGNSLVIPDGWISCSERMPEESECVLIWDGRFRKVSFTMYGHWQVLEPEAITHWMPLPLPPSK